MTEHTYQVAYVVTQTVRVRSEDPDPESGHAELRQVQDKMAEAVEELFVQGVGRALRVVSREVRAETHCRVPDRRPS